MIDLKFPRHVTFIVSEDFHTQINTSRNVCFSCAVKLVGFGRQVDAVLTEESFGKCANGNCWRKND